MTTSRILRCLQCGSYALAEKCQCGGARLPPKPAKYSPDDKYADYRRRYKEQQGGQQPQAERPVPKPMHPLEAKRKGL